MEESKFIEKERFVGMPIKMFAYGHNDLFITKKDENAFILFYVLDVMTRNLYTWGEIETSISLLSKKLPLKNKESDNRAEIKRLLLSLFDKGFIKVFHDEVSLNYDTLLTVRIPELDDPHIMEVVTSDNFKHTGWLPVTEEMFRACNGNARHLKAIIYVEWRMFRNSENVGTYCISYGELEKVLDISHPSAVKLINEMVELKLIKKTGGRFYMDQFGKSRKETNKYTPVDENQRHEYKLQEKGANTDSLEKKQNTRILSMVNEMDVTDSRTKSTNLFNPSKDVFLTPKCWFVWSTTECKATKAQGDKRFGAFKQANPNRYNELAKEGEKLKKKYEHDMQTLKMAEEITPKFMNSKDNRFNYYDDDNDDEQYHREFSNAFHTEKRNAKKEEADKLAAILD